MVKTTRGMHLIAASEVSALSSENVLVALTQDGNPAALATRLLMPDTTLDSRRLVLTESPCPAAVARIAFHPDIWHQQRPLYAKYAEAAVSGGGSVDIEYVRPEYGRFTVKYTAMMSCTPMWCNARSALCSGGELDIDAVQCQPNLLLSIMQRMTAADPDDTPPFEALAYMCAHRRVSEVHGPI
jgi:hypothetical protein